MSYPSIRALLTPKEVGKILRRSEKTLETWRRKHKGPRPIRVEGRVLYYEHEVLAYLERCAKGQKR